MERSMPMRTQTEARSVVPTLNQGAVSLRQSTEARCLLAQARNDAYAQAAQGRLGEGVNLLAEALALEPSSHELLSDIAALLLSAGELEQAALHAHRAIQIQPDHGPSLYTLGFAMSGLGEAKAAIEVLSALGQGEALASLMREAPDLLPLVRTELKRLSAAA